MDHHPRAEAAIAAELGWSTARDALEALDRAGLRVVGRIEPPSSALIHDHGEEPPFAPGLVAGRPPHEDPDLTR